jgi:DNA-binding protein H-NS
MDISTLSVAELKSLLEMIPAEIKAREKAEKAKIRKEIDELARKHGYSLEELLGEAAEKVVKVKKPAPIRYRSADGQSCWSGRGRTPLWMAEALAAGKSKQDFAV